MIERLYRLARGVLTVRFRGRNTARLLNLCARSGMIFWDMEYLDGDQLRARMYLYDVYGLAPFLRKTHVRFAVEERAGLPFFLRRYRARKVCVLTVLAMIAAVAALSTRIWRIEVIGNSAIGEQTILTYLGEKNIGYGVRKAAIDNDALELSLRQDFDGIIWASVYEQGTKLVVSLQEKLATAGGGVSDDACVDLVAEKDATVLSIVTRSGVPLVKAGDTVKAGDPLVLGRQEILDDAGEVREYYYKSADADVIAAVVYSYEDWINPKVFSSRATGRETMQFYLSVGNWQLRFPPLFADYDDYETLEDIRQLVLMDSFYLPVHFGKIRQIERETAEYTLLESEARALAGERLNQFLSDLEENGVSISDKNVMIEMTDGQYHIFGEISAQENITRAVPTELLQKPSGGESAGGE